ncbi:TIGR04372 family glycosyltransferase [Magnetospirillum sp. SS-4]|uniref:TIGR04372 family glycosyltransferase n=1 Tax=Magnetospirillum sp. SS-4 TaxID=2681465 RepID=UPI001571813A|nr:TIGR04372 family glycosyltransferase [Magnetospirillum sp. SS-4]
MLKRIQHVIGRALAKTLSYLFILPVLYLIEPFWRIRLTHLWVARFGPLAYNTHVFVGTRILEGPEPRTTRLFFGARPANQPLFTMWKRILPIIENPILSAFYHYAGPTLSKTRFFRPLPNNYHDHRPLNVGPVLSFSKAEEERGQSLLRDMGLTPDDWFVVFQSRDASFHAQTGLGDSGTHRLCSIDGFMAAAGEITRRGGYAIRIGAGLNTPLPENGNSRIIDYATRFRRDWADIYLLGKCRFLLAPGTGTVFVPGLFGRPVAQSNMLPYIPNPMGRHSLYTTKLLKDARTGRILNFAELYEMGAFNFFHPHEAMLRFPRELDEYGLIAVDNDEEEILGLCLDMIAQLDGNPVNPEAARLQRLYKTQFLNQATDIDLIPDLAPSFALKYRYLIEA